MRRQALVFGDQEEMGFGARVATQSPKERRRDREFHGQTNREEHLGTSRGLV